MGGCGLQLSTLGNPGGVFIRSARKLGANTSQAQRNMGNLRSRVSSMGRGKKHRPSQHTSPLRTVVSYVLYDIAHSRNTPGTHCPPENKKYLCCISLFAFAPF